MQATKTLSELAEYVDGRVCGDPSVVIKSASTLGRAGKGDISFLANNRYEKQLRTTKASAVIVGKETANTSVPLLIAEDPYYAFMQIMVLLHGHRKHKKVGISPRASISDSAKVGADCHIHDFVTVADNAKVGDGCIVYPCVHIGQGVQIGNDCIIYPNVTVYDACMQIQRSAKTASAMPATKEFIIRYLRPVSWSLKMMWKSAPAVE
jgi:UDP-3-O-[3-hydroxymyristoyl] glucosamine N-acyltransferase